MTSVIQNIKTDGCQIWCCQRDIQALLEQQLEAGWPYKTSQNSLNI